MLLEMLAWHRHQTMWYELSQDPVNGLEFLKTRFRIRGTYAEVEATDCNPSFQAGLFQSSKLLIQLTVLRVSLGDLEGARID